MNNKMFKSHDDYVFNKNLKNNQNYVLNERISLELFMNFYLKKSGFLIVRFIKFIIIKFILRFYNNEYKNIILLTCFLLVPVLLFPFYYIWLPGYLILNLYVTFLFLNVIEDFKLSKVYFVGVRKGRTKRTYLNSFVNYFSLPGDLIMNNGKILLVSLLHSLLVYAFIVFIYV